MRANSYKKEVAALSDRKTDDEMSKNVAELVGHKVALAKIWEAKKQRYSTMLLARVAWCAS